MRTENQARIIDALSEEIHAQSYGCAAEQHNPQRAADEMDEYIKKRAENVRNLRRIRDELEDLFTGVV